MESKLLRGETVADVFAKLGLQGVELREATSVLAEKVDLRSLKAGNQYSAFFNPDSTLASFEMTLAGSGRVEMVRQGAAMAERLAAVPARRSRCARSRAPWSGSLEDSIRLAGGPPALAYRLADVFQWDLDFTKDLQRGDRFQVLYEEVQLDGRFHDVGTILAAVYDNQGRLHEAYRYGDSGVYYDGEGRPMRKMFLRSPLRYSHVTSSFSLHRFHPVLKEFRPHYGVDYGAPVGTPVQVTANGVVTFAGWDRGGGNVVKVQHPGGYVTAYLHLSRFAAGIRPGARVRQGDIIAFTGATGLASGPHLDYRVKYRDDWIDPLTLKSVRDEPIPERQPGGVPVLARRAAGGPARTTRLAQALRLPSVPGPSGRETQLAVGRTQRPGPRAPESPASAIRLRWSVVRAWCRVDFGRRHPRHLAAGPVPSRARAPSTWRSTSP